MSIFQYERFRDFRSSREFRQGFRRVAAYFGLVGLSILTIFVFAGGASAAVHPSATLEQCSNIAVTCDSDAHDAQWQTGNLGQSNSSYLEGESVPYRATFKDLTVGQTYMATLQWDTTQSGKHAIDYPTSYDRTELTAMACAGIACGGTNASLAIPMDPEVASAGVTQLSGQYIRAFGASFPANNSSVPNSGNLCGVLSTCTITSNPSSYSHDGTFAGNSSAGFNVYFTATHTTSVLAWGGHIASRADWGNGHSAVGISGSPFHMRLLDLLCSNVSNCGVGRMDRSLSSEAVIYPASITIVKEAATEGSTQFDFQGSPLPLNNFTLIDNGTSANRQTFSGITNFATYTVTESLVNGWNFNSASCAVLNANGGTQSVLGRIVTIGLTEGENVTCTYLNSKIPVPSIRLSKTSTNSQYSFAGDILSYDYVITNTGEMTLGPIQFKVDDDRINSGNPFDCGPAGSTLAPGETISCAHDYLVTAGDVNEVSVVNNAFAIATELVSPTVQLTILYVAPVVTTTTAPIVTTTTVPVTTTTTAPIVTTTTVPVTTTTVIIQEVTTTTVVAPTTTTSEAPPTTSPTPTTVPDLPLDNSQDILLQDLLPETQDLLPETGISGGVISILLMSLFAIGIVAIGVSTYAARREDRNRS